MADIQIRITDNTSDVLKNLSEVENKLAKLSGKPYKVSIDVDKSSITKLEKAVSSTSNGADKAKKSLDGVASSSKNVGDSASKGSSGVKNLNDAMKEGTSVASSFGKQLKDSLFNQAALAMINGVRKAFSSALEEMKNVDKELINIKKVSEDLQKNPDKLKAIGDSVYSTASKYGVSASDYASSIYTFTKAGYGDAASQLAELATKTMLVGDVTQDLADQFVLSVDKAWEYGGSIEKLSNVIDEADYINNNYATSLEKITQGLPTAASVASMAGMSAEETMAALGTITATTQETGKKAGTALRALILNILGDTTTEVEEGVTLSKESLQSLNEVVQKYASDATKAKMAAGELIDPMETLSELAQAWNSGTMTEVDLYKIEESLGGKLRTNQLAALLKNWEGTYEEMLDGMGNAAGTAQREVDTMLESWDAKTKILKNTWTDFVQKTLDTGVFKGILDVATNLLETFGNLGNVMAGIAAFVAVKNFSAITDIVELVVLFNANLKATAAIEGAATAATAGLDAALKKLGIDMGSAGAAAGGIVALLGGLAVLNKMLNDSVDASVEASRNAESQDEAIAHAEEAILKRASANDKKFKNDTQIIKSTVKEYEELSRQLEEAKESGDKFSEWLINNKLDKIKDPVEAYLAAIGELEGSSGEAVESNEELSESAEKAVRAYDELANAVENATQELSAYDEATKGEKGDNFKKYADIYKDMMNAMADGLTGSNKFKEGIKSLMGADNVAKLLSEGKSWEEIGQGLGSKFWQGVFNAEGNDYGSNFAFELFDKISSDNTWANALKDVINISKDSDGSLSVMVDDFDALSKALGELTGVAPDPEMLASWMDALGIYNSDIETSAENIKGLADAYGALDAATGKIDVQKFVSGLASEGLDPAQIWDYVNALLALDETDPDVTVTTNDLQEIQGYIEGAKAEVEETDGTEATVEINEEGADSVKAQIDSVAQKIRELDGKTANVKIKQTTEVGSNASGTDDAVGGATLVNEKGPEIIQYGNKAWIAGGGAPAIENIPAGAMVFDANETKQILSRSGLEGFMGTIGSAAGGTASGIKRYTGKTITYTGSSTKTSSSSSSKSSSSSGSKNQSDAQKKKIDQLKDIVNLRKSELALLEAQDAPVRQQIDKQREIQDAIKKQIDYMVSIKASQEDINKLWTEWYKIESDVAKLQKDMLNDLSDAIDTEKDALEEERDALIEDLQKQLDALEEEEDAEDKLLTLEEKRLKVQEAQNALANANAERTVRYYNAATGQWEWRANASNVKSAQESLDNAIKDLQDYEKQLALDNTKQEIQNQIDAIEKQYQDAIDAWEEIQESMEEPAKTIAEALQKIADNFTPAMLDDLDKLNQKLAKFGYALDIEGLSPVKSYTGVYDDGGVLKGLGGIKATSADEMVIPPMLTRKMLSPTATGTFKQRMEELSFMYGATRNLAGRKTYGIGTQNNGDTYQLGGITMTTAQAKSTTVYELARMSKNLRAYNAG